MSAPTRLLYPFPAELARIARDRSAVIEASAGTARPFWIAHLAVDEQRAPYLEAYLARGGASGSVDSLEALLYRAHQLRAQWGTPFDPERIAAAAQAFARLTPAELEVTTTGMHGSTAKAVSARL